MEIRADGTTRATPFESRGAVVAEPVHDAPERLCAGIELRPARVVLEACEPLLPAPLELALEQDVPDHPRIARHGLVREEPDPWHPRAVPAAVAAPEELVAATDGEQCHSASLRRVKRIPLRAEVGRDKSLLAILAAADVQEVVRARVERVSHAKRPNLELVTTERRPPREDGDVSAIGVDVEVLRIEVADADPQATRSSQYGRTAPRFTRIFRSESIAV